MLVMVEESSAYGVSPAVEIVPGLYVGHIHAIRNIDFLHSHNINVIINCTRTQKYDNPLPGRIERYRVPFSDHRQQSSRDLMEKMLPNAVRVIRKAILANKNVLVHCYAGRNRSPILVAAYLIKYGGLTPMQAIKVLKHLWRFTADHFIPVLNNYYEKSKHDVLSSL
jgi:protein tyrosine phosphatase